jgi:RNA polymerase sigma factor (sigma-70 family)
LTTENEQDVELLRTNPKQLIVKYHKMVEIVVKKYISTGMFEATEFDDIVQSVMESLLSKLPAMQRQYNATSLFKTYLAGIIRNICLKLYHKNTRRVKSVELDGSVQSEPDDLTDRHLIDHVVSRFRVVVGLYHSQRPKLLLCLKLYFRLPVVAQDIRLPYPLCTPADLESLLRSFDGKYETMNEYEIYEIVTPIMNKYERKSNSADALRKWTHSKIQEIIRILNGDPPRFNFDKETLRILVEDHFVPFLNRR